MELARPNKRRALETCKQYGGTMQKICIENCHRNIQDVTFVPVHDAVYFIKLKKRKPIIEQQRLRLRMKKLQKKINEAKMAKMQETIQQLYYSLKKLLLIPIEDDDRDDQVVRFGSVIRNKLCKMMDHSTEAEENYFDHLLEHISDKLAIWIINLINSNQLDVFADSVSTKSTTGVSELSEDQTVAIQEVVTEAATQPPENTITNAVTVAEDPSRANSVI